MVTAKEREITCTERRGGKGRGEEGFEAREVDLSGGGGVRRHAVSAREQAP